MDRSLLADGEGIDRSVLLRSLFIGGKALKTLKWLLNYFLSVKEVLKFVLYNSFTLFVCR